MPPSLTPTGSHGGDGWRLPGVEKSGPSRRAKLWGLIVVVAVIGLMAAVLAGGDNTSQQAATQPAPTNTTPAQSKPVKPAKPAKPAPAKPAKPVKPAKPSDAKSRAQAQRDRAERLMDRAEAFVKKSDHPADGKPGVLVNDS